tara:strand:+ start:92903 stop:93058 length:156 start_codon:yes stop_codon:yes gene_type:complete
LADKEYHPLLCWLLLATLNNRYWMDSCFLKMVPMRLVQIEIRRLLDSLLSF